MLWWLKHLFSSIKETREPYYKQSVSGARKNVASVVSLKLDAPAEREQERQDEIADKYRTCFGVPADDLLLLKHYSMEQQADPNVVLSSYDFIHRLADGTFVARYLVLDTKRFDKPSESYRIFWKYDGNNRKLLQGDLP